MTAKFMKRITAVVLSILMLTSVFCPMPTFAEGGSSTGPVDAEGVETKKTVTPKPDGGFTITLEAYTTGEVEKKSVPLDIVLLLDQSGSMSNTFSGRTSRQDAMKDAVTGFISSVGAKYDEEADHRIAIVTFGTNASTTNFGTSRDPVYWMFADPTGGNSSNISRLNKSVNDLTINSNSRTNVNAGFTNVTSLFNSATSSYTGDNEERQQVLIVFTDGVPTNSNQGSYYYDFNTDVADPAVAQSKNLKDKGVLVYAIGIFSGANASELYGTNPPYSGNCDGSVDTTWYVNNPTNGENAIDFTAANRFLNLLSSNSKTATDVGVTRVRSTRSPTRITYTITKKYTLEKDANYYLTASSADELNAVFDQIASALNTIDLGTKTEVADIVTPYFAVPADASNVHVYTAKADVKNDEIVFGDKETEAGLTAKIDGDKVSVIGFDFTKNCVTKEAKEDDTHGKKLIIEFDIYPKDDFFGGNDIPTNDDTKSGIYDKDGKLIENFVAEYPNGGKGVDVPVPDEDDIELTTPDRNIYLFGSLTGNDLIADTQLKIKNFTLDLDEEDYGLSADDKWIAEYVDIELNTSDSVSNATADSTYTVTATVKGKKAETTNKTEKSGTGNVNVWKPVATFKDSNIYVGATPNYTENFVKTEWKHGDLTTMPAGTAPTVTYTYTPAASAFTEDTYVNAAAKIGNTAIDDYITFAHTDHEGCTFNKNTGEFIVHVWTPTVKYQDSLIYLGATAPAYADANFVSVTWKNANSATKPAGNEPTLTYTYAPTAGAFTTDTYVTATVKNGTTDITDSVVFEHADCSLVDSCSFDSTKGQFLVHVKSCELTVKKAGDVKADDTFIFTVTGPNNTNIQVVLKGGESITIKNLPVGEYTVTEDSNWSWRYDSSKMTGSTTLSKDKSSDTVTITNELESDTWLDSSDSIDNFFGIPSSK